MLPRLGGRAWSQDDVRKLALVNRKFRDLIYGYPACWTIMHHLFTIQRDTSTGKPRMSEGAGLQVLEYSDCTQWNQLRCASLRVSGMDLDLLARKVPKGTSFPQLAGIEFGGKQTLRRTPCHSKDARWLAHPVCAILVHSGATASRGWGTLCRLGGIGFPQRPDQECERHSRFGRRPSETAAAQPAPASEQAPIERITCTDRGSYLITVSEGSFAVLYFPPSAKCYRG